MASHDTTGPRLLVLWDIDHTLIETGGVGREVFREAFERTTGHPMTRMAEVTGRTEPDIFRETAELHEITTTPELFESFAEHLAAGYREHADKMRERGRALPGAREALGSLAEANGIVQSVLTGNTREVAEIKLATFGLTHHLDFEAGAYGSDHPVRAQLVEIAQRRAKSRYAVTFDNETTVLIGDTPSDVATGRDGGARVIGVASGSSTSEELVSAGAELTLVDLRDGASLRTALAIE